MNAPSTKLGIVAIMALASALALSANAADAIAADDTVDAKDIVHLPKLFSAVKAYGAVDFRDLLPEVADLDSEESTALSAHFATVLNLKNDTVEANIEQGLGMLLQGVEAIRALHDILAKIKNPNVAQEA